MVSRQLTVSNVRDIAFRHTGIRPFRQRLWARAADDLVPVQLDQNDTLEWYGFVSGQVTVAVDDVEG